MIFYRISWCDNYGSRLQVSERSGRQEWFKSKRDADTRHRELSATANTEVGEVVRVNFGRNKSSVLNALELNATISLW